MVVLQWSLLAIGLVALSVAAFLHWPWRRQYPPAESFLIDPVWQGKPYPLEQRVITIDGSRNCRDLGGYPTQNGGTVRSGEIIRCAHLGSVTPEGKATLEAKGLRFICDLRTPAEAEERPDQPIEGARYLHHPVFDTNPAGLTALGRIILNRGRIDRHFRNEYIRMITERAPRFGEALTFFADPANRPALFHCTAGKDRAGITAALLLAILGVPEDVIIADYTQSNLSFHDLNNETKPAFESLRHLGLTVDDIQPMMVADPGNMRTVFALIHEGWGSVETYLLEAAKMQPETIQRLREDLICP